MPTFLPLAYAAAEDVALLLCLEHSGSLHGLFPLPGMHSPWISASSTLQTLLSSCSYIPFSMRPLQLCCVKWCPIPTPISALSPLLKAFTWLSIYFFDSMYHLLIRYIHYLFIICLQFVFCLLPVEYKSCMGTDLCLPFHYGFKHLSSAWHILFNTLFVESIFVIVWYLCPPLDMQSPWLFFPSMHT